MTEFENFIKNLQENLKQPLPSWEAQLSMLPPSRLNSKLHPNELTRKSAVLILFYPNQSQISLPLILRPAYDGVHGGQMAFPGGRQEKEDENLIRTALRETQEEIGIRAIDVHILGNLTEIFIPPSNFTCLPVIGYLNYKPPFYPDNYEVDTIFEVNLVEILDKNIVSKTKIKTSTLEFETPCYLIQNKVVWGATAVMIAELLAVINTKKQA